MTQIPIMIGLRAPNKDDISSGTALKHFGFSYCGWTDADLFLTIAEQCPNLNTIELGFSPSQCQEKGEEKDEILRHLFTSLQLTSVKLSDCSYLTDQTIRDLLSVNMDTLENLEIYSDGHLTTQFSKSRLE